MILLAREEGSSPHQQGCSTSKESGHICQPCKKGRIREDERKENTTLQSRFWARQSRKGCSAMSRWPSESLAARWPGEELKEISFSRYSQISLLILTVDLKSSQASAISRILLGKISRWTSWVLSKMNRLVLVIED